MEVFLPLEKTAQTIQRKSLVRMLLTPSLIFLLNLVTSTNFQKVSAGHHLSDLTLIL